MRPSFLRAASLSLLATLAACSSNAPSPAQEPEIAQSTQERNLAPNVSPDDFASLVRDNNAFAADMYGALGSTVASGQNLFFSPLSISEALAMMYAGARGDTATEMANALHFRLPQERLHPAFDALDLALASRAKDAPQGSEPFSLHTANSLWVAKGMPLVPAFLDTLAENYGAGVRLADFASAPERSRQEINKWVEDQTNDKIVDLLGQGIIDSSTRTVLVNAIYLKAPWLSRFEKWGTATAPFHGIHGDKDVDMMHQTGRLAYAKGTGWTAVELPYEGHDVSLVAVLPDDFEAYEQTFNADAAALIGTVPPPYGTAIALSFPKLTIAGASLTLDDALEARGMKHAFADADFSGMTPEGIAITAVIHKAYLAIDENGTEAAAATAVGADSAAAEEPPTLLPIAFDKPFVFFIRDKPTGSILFLGRYIAP